MYAEYFHPFLFFGAVSRVDCMPTTSEFVSILAVSIAS